METATGLPLVAQMVKNANAGGVRDVGLIPGSGRSPGEGNGSSLQYSCLENFKDRSLVGYSPWGHTELDMSEWLTLPLFMQQGEGTWMHRVAEETRVLKFGQDMGSEPDSAQFIFFEPHRSPRQMRVILCTLQSYCEG